MRCLSLHSTLVCILAGLVQLASCAVVEYDWDIRWVSANPDGRLTRPVIGVNGVWPPPTIHVNKGDQLVVHITNSLGNETTTIHWHGLYLEGSNGMDGPSMVTQCPIPPGMGFTYNFTINQPGTYWYHSHDSGQYPDGLRGALIVHDPESPFTHRIDGELILTFSDWYHDQMPQLISHYVSVDENPDGGEPVPYSGLLNDGVPERQNLQVEPNKTYLLRIVSLAAFAQAYVWIDDHDFEIVEVDGIYTEPTKVGAVYLATAQRYSVLLRTKPAKAGGQGVYTIMATMDTDDFDDVPDYVSQNATASLVYPHRPWSPQILHPHANCTTDELDMIDEFDLIPFDKMPALTGVPDRSITLNLSFITVANQNRAAFNNITYLPPKVPTLFSILSASDSQAPALTNASIYGVHTNPQVALYGDLVEVVINNFDTGAHIMHFHGHAVQLVAKVANVVDFGGDTDGTDEEGQPYTGDESLFPQYPVRRDTWVLAPHGYTVVRFRATNPGVWLFHCHMEWHMDAGLVSTLIVAPEKLRKTQSLNPAMMEICKAGGIETTGNCAGNEDYFDLDGQTLVPNAVQKGALIG